MAKIKICGLFRAQDVEYVNEASPDYIGFVFAKSRRQVSPDNAALLRAGLKDDILPVGVFVDAPLCEIAKIYERGIIRAVQLHGREDEKYFVELRKLCSIPIIKAIQVSSAQDILNWQDSSVDYLLLDHGTGGSGERFDWDLIRCCKKPYFLAGGIHLDNMGEALSHKPYCVDISSGAETAGIKDRDKIRKLVEKVREGDA